MKIKTLTLAFLGLLLCISFASAQQPAREFVFAGTAKDSEGVAKTAITFFIEGNNTKRWAVTDEKGNFMIRLPAGKYTLKPDDNIYKNFTVFIEIFPSGLNPTNLELTVESKKNWCRNCPEGKMPEVVKYVTPPYPAVARAVGADGEVSVSVKIDKEGKVISVEAHSGHPLLRFVSAQAARGWTFSPDETIAERAAYLVFAFSSDYKENNKTVFRKPNRLEIIGVITVDINSHSPASF